MTTPQAPLGGQFILASVSALATFTPEQLSTEARMMARSAEEFLRKEALPVGDRLEAHEEGLMPSLLRRAGAAGLLGAGLPEAYGGFDLPRSTQTALVEKMSADLSFAISAGVHSGVATLPLLYFGTDAQKQRYLPRLATGEILGAFALTEADSGSDALKARTKATLSSDGKHYILNGAKMWITNAGFADLFTIFAQVDGERFTAFLVDRHTPGLSIGREEHKLGLKGSSTCRLILENVHVPMENVLGAVGEGHRPALYVLNIGRFNIGVTALGAAKENLRVAVQYAKQRIQFGRPIAEFGLIQTKLAEMTARLYLLESMVYRIAGYWDLRFGAIDPTDNNLTDLYRAATEEYSIECAIIKLYGTEALGFVVDEALQIHGGYGFSEEYPVARAYRDVRVFRIFEGTNEINRLTVTDQILRRLQRNRLTLPTETPSGPPMDRLSEPNVSLSDGIEYLRHALHEMLRRARPALEQSIQENEETAGAIADLVATLFALESGWLRYMHSGKAMSPDVQDVSLAVLQLSLYAAMHQTATLQNEIDAFCTNRSSLSRHDTNSYDLLQFNPVALRRQIAQVVINRETFPW